MHAGPDPEKGAYRPGGHARHADAPPALYWPGTQLPHDDDAESTVKRPGGQSSHAAIALRLPNLPGLQLAHVVSLPRPKVAAGHAVPAGVVEARAQAKPGDAEHARHDDSDALPRAVLYRPEGQAVQDVKPSVSP